MSSLKFNNRKQIFFDLSMRMVLLMCLSSYALSSYSYEINLQTGSEEQTNVEITGYTGTITTTDAANITDGEYINISNGTETITYEFDTAGDGVSPGNVAVDLSGSMSAQQVKDSLINSINTSSLTGVSAVSNGSDTVQLSSSAATPLAINEFVSNSGFQLSDITTTTTTTTTLVNTDATIFQQAQASPGSVFTGQPYTGTITSVSPANIQDGETITISDGVNAVVYELDTQGDGVSPGNVQVDLSSANSVADVTGAIVNAINTAPLVDVSAVVGSNDTLELTSSTLPFSISDTVGDGGFTVTEPQVSLSPVDLSFDYLFESLTGELQVLINGDIVGDLLAPGILQNGYATYNLTITDTALLDQIGLNGVELMFNLTGADGSSILLDNIQFAGLLNGDFETGSIDPWNIYTQGSSSAALSMQMNQVPEPGTVALLGVGLVGVFLGRKKRKGGGGNKI